MKTDTEKESGLLCHTTEVTPGREAPGRSPEAGLYDYGDLLHVGFVTPPRTLYVHNLGSIDEILERDIQREKDGFPKKVRIGKLVKPGRGGKDKIVVVPTTVEEKFIHDTRPVNPGQDGSSGGSGDGDEGSVIGEEPVHGTGGAGSGGAGQGESGDHDIESGAYDLGRVLTERFELPNLKEKGKKRSLKRFTYELTDRHHGFGQVLDKKATFRNIIQTNINLGNIPDSSEIDLTKFLVTPQDNVYRVLSKEQDLEAQALVFFLRDYSGSMGGRPTEMVVTQHVLIYSWLLYHYNRQVETRFVLHDTEAREVPDFYTYYTLSVAGGTNVESAYRLVNNMVEEQNLDRDYNIYIFHGTDGDDWESNGKRTVAEIKKMLRYCNRIGITVTQSGEYMTNVERYIRGSGFLEEYSGLIKLDTIRGEANENRLIEGIKRLIG